MTNIELKKFDISNIPEKSREFEGFKAMNINIQVRKDEIIFIFYINFFKFIEDNIFG